MENVVNNTELSDGDPIIVSDKTIEEAMREYVQSDPLVQRCEDLLRHR